jgi:hypothetical protein
MKFPQMRDVPELKEVLSKYSCLATESPQCVISGDYRSAALGQLVIVTTFAQNDIYAHRIRKEIEKSGSCWVQRTEYHLSGDSEFSIAIWLRLSAERSRLGK